jgi:transmembrane sensor
MSAGQRQTDLNEIDLEALRWIARIERGPLGPHEQRSFTEWLAADIRHQGALIRVQAAELRIDRLAALAGGHSVVGSPPPLTKQTTRRRLIAAVAAAVAFAGITVLWEHQSVQEAGGTRYVNGVGELTKVALADGSVVTMNTQTELRVRYSSERRDIDLVRGEALFTVAHNSRRPFAVHVGQWSAVAVGTEFSVRRLSEPTADVVVTEGTIRLLPQDGTVTSAPQITANQKALIGADGQVQIDSLSDSQITQQLAWRSHLVIFDGKPLREALTEMNRYTRKPIVVEDPALAERLIAGVFSTTDTKTFVSAMTATLGVQAVAKEDVVLLRSLN